MFIGKYNRSLIVTYLGVAFAVVGMYFAFQLKTKYSMICLVLAGICDLFDGKIARMCKRDKDEISFGLNEWYHVLGYILLAMAGIQRLAHFNVLVGNKKDDSPVKAYSGLPVTSTSITFPFIYLLSKAVSLNTYHIIYIGLVYLTAFLFVFNIKIPKFKGIAYPILAVVGVIGIIALFLV